MPTAARDTLQQALSHARSGNLAEAEELCEDLLAQPVVDPEAPHLLGVIRNIQCRYAEAEPLLRRAVAEHPAIAKYHSNLGNALRGLERLAEAEACYRWALTLDPALDDARVNLAKLLHTTRQWEEAIVEYMQLITRNPKDIGLQASLAFLLLSTNQIAEAEEVVAEGLKREPTDPGMNLAMAICERRAGKFEQALRRFDTIDPAGMEVRIAAAFHYERGLLYDRLNLMERAWTEFAEGNRQQAEGIKHSRIDKTHYTKELDRLAQMDVEWLRNVSMSGVSGTSPSPAFLVGFPRSGTTLLDQILDSHPNIQTLEEKPIVNRLCDEMDTLLLSRPGGLKALEQGELVRLRQNYFEYVADFIDLQPGNLLVDKLPLSITRVPYILRVFPDARFILALRHPCDCVLSCYMHLFEPNDAMANFYTLEDTAALYAKVMGLWRHWAERLPLRYHPVYYERLVHDLAGEIKPLLGFLGVEWRENMARPHEHAARKGVINTPSHSQVTQPIYQRAAGRWRRYLPYLGEVMSTLEPYIEYFGYDRQESVG
ncbi:MAG: sulfotransferase [Thiobacillaceae bacterium]